MQELAETVSFPLQAGDDVLSLYVSYLYPTKLKKFGA